MTCQICEAHAAPRELVALRKFYAAWREIKDYGGRYTMDMAEAELEIEAALSEREAG